MLQEKRLWQLFENVVVHTDDPVAIGMLAEVAARLGEPAGRIGWLLEESARQKVSSSRILAL